MSVSTLITGGLGSFSTVSYFITQGLGNFSAAAAPNPTRWQYLTGVDELRHILEGSGVQRMKTIGTDQTKHAFEGAAR